MSRSTVRAVRPGAAFLACRGARRHGLEFAADVAQRGAAAILWEPDGSTQAPTLQSDIVLAAVPQLSRHASELAARFFEFPSRQLAVVGVTGTNGKTTCAWLLAQALDAVGGSAAYLGTLGSSFGGELTPGEMTTPDAVTVQRQLADFRARGARPGGDGGFLAWPGAGACAGRALRCGGVHQPHPRPSGFPRRHGKLWRSQGEPVRARRSAPARVQRG